MSTGSLLSQNTNTNYAHHQHWMLNTPEEPCKVYLSTRVGRFAYSSSDHLRTMRCKFRVHSQTRDFQLARSVSITFVLPNAWQSVSSSQRHPVEHLCLLSWMHTSNSSQRNKMPLYGTFQLLHHPLNVQAHLIVMIWPNDKCHCLNGLQA
jgi:hypothetical protein